MMTCLPYLRFLSRCSSLAILIWASSCSTTQSFAFWVSPSSNSFPLSCLPNGVSRSGTPKKASSLGSSEDPSNTEDSEDRDFQNGYNPRGQTRKYNLGLGKNLPVTGSDPTFPDKLEDLQWNPPEPVRKPSNHKSSVAPSSKVQSAPERTYKTGRRTRKMVARSQQLAELRGALWHEEHYGSSKDAKGSQLFLEPTEQNLNYDNQMSIDPGRPLRPKAFYPDIDLSIPQAVYSPEDSIDLVWDLMRWEAYQEAQREPLLVSFLYSTILNHPSLESSLAFMLANKLASPAMISTQIQSLILLALKNDAHCGRSLRADILAVRDRDPACTCLPDVFLYFKGFHALQTYRVAHVLWKTGKQVLAHYLQSQMSTTFQIDIHPNATLGSGIMLDHGTGIVIGETAHVGHNCSILHHVTLGGSGKKGVDRHPKVGQGVLLGAGASVLGNVKIGDGCQVGAGTLVITDLPAHSVAVGVPAKIIGSFVDVTEQPSIEMNQMMDAKIVTFQSDGI